DITAMTEFDRLIRSPSWRGQPADQSGTPAFRRPSMSLAISSDRRYGPTLPLRLEMRRAGSTCRNRVHILLRSAARPESALLAAAMRNEGRESGFSCNTIAAHEDAWS